MNPNQPARAGVRRAHSCRQAGIVVTIAVSMLVTAAPRLRAQAGGAPAGRGRDLVAIDFANASLGAPPAEIRVLRGKFEVVNKDGTRMLRCSEEGAFLLMVPEKIPNKFALEFDLVPKFSGETNTTELSFEGTREVSHSEESAHVHWSHNKVSVIGGGQTYAGGQIDLPEDLREEVIGNLTKIRAEFDGSNLTVKTNGRQVFESKIAKFTRGRVVRVSLGGTDEGDSAVYLASVRMTSLDGGAATAQQQGGVASTPAPGTQTAEGSSQTAVQQPAGTVQQQAPMTVTGINATLDPSGVAIVKWDPLPVSATYIVLRWNVADPYCCNNMVPPDAAITGTAWQDLGIQRAGTYAYRVIGQTANGLVYGEARFDFAGAGTQASPTGTVATTTQAPQPGPSTDSVYQAPSTDTVYQPPSTDTVTQPPATGLPSTGTVLVPESGEPAPYSSGPRRVSIMPTETAPSTDSVYKAPSTDTVYEMPASSELPTLDTAGTQPASTTTEPVTVRMAEPVMQTGTMVGIATVEPAKTTSDTGGGITTSGRYRVTIAGISVTGVTKDDILNIDGMGNEVFAAAAVVNWNRQRGQLAGFSFAQTRDYGDIADGSRFGNRIRAGSASSNGGLAAGDSIPGSFDPKAAVSSATPASDQFPLLVWEGTMSVGAEAIIVAPSLWEHDATRVQLNLYKQNWTKASFPLLMSARVVTDQLWTSSIAPALAPLSTLVEAAPPAPTFTGMPTDGYKMAIMIFPPGEDRPIGMGSGGPGVVTYREQIVVITQEKLASLAVGAGTTFALPYAEPMDIFLGGNFMLWMRVERLQ